jgi:hypothetical protein
VPKPSKEGGAYIIMPTPTMGKGMFATRNIEMGEIIFAERPLFIAPSALYPPSSEMKKRDAELRKYSHEDMEKVFLFERERQREVAMGKMDPERREKFLGLTNAFKEDEEDGTGPLFGIACTNMYGCWELWDGDAEPGPQEIYGMVCDVGSRINHRLDSGFFNGNLLTTTHQHSCQPNITQVFNIRSFSAVFMASRDIKSGEQLFYTYCNLLTTAAERKLSLAPYGITNCTCASCTNATPETDALRTNFHTRVREYLSRSVAWNSNGDSPDKSTLDEMFEFQKAVIKEGLHTQSDYWHYFMVALIVACKLAKMENELVTSMRKLQKFSIYNEAKVALMDSE